MVCRFTKLAAVLAALTGVAVCGPVASAGNNPPKGSGPRLVPAPVWAGSYMAHAAGFYSGDDSAFVNPDDTVTFTLKLRDPAGNPANLQIVGIKIVDGHFRGTGKVNGLKLDVEGRFDAPAPGQPWKIRFSCSYRDANGRAGRIIGIKGT